MYLANRSMFVFALHLINNKLDKKKIFDVFPMRKFCEIFLASFFSHQILWLDKNPYKYEYIFANFEVESLSPEEANESGSMNEIQVKEEQLALEEVTYIIFFICTLVWWSVYKINLIFIQH